MHSEMNLLRKVEPEELLKLFAGFALGVLVDKTSGPGRAMHVRQKAKHQKDIR